ncbi:VCBS domain-containing protein, partial [Methylobrevis pamukkalensis]|uniref:VCBS domain-containing protein n=1 Tax=Methylobrevis pamukkalensis TaxID=1439726 RepID=UPI001AECAA83
MTTFGWTEDAEAGTWTKDGLYGSAVLDVETGVVTYTLDNSRANVQALGASAGYYDVFLVSYSDASLSPVIQPFFFVATGTNDLSVISGTLAATLTEDETSTLIATGTVTLTDIDIGDTTTLVGGTFTGAYGSLVLNVNGTWTYTADSTQTAIQAIGDDESLTDTFTIVASDGATQTITVTIDGVNELVEGTSLDDVLSGGSYADSIYGFDGDDVIVAGSGKDKIYGATGDDHVTAGSGDDIVDGGADDDTILGGSGDDEIDGGDGDDWINAGSDDDTVLGGDGDDTIYGGSGNDDLDGGTGADHMIGGTGDDTYHIDDLADVMEERADQGIDTVVSAMDHTLGENFENLTLAGSALLGTGNADDNTLVGNELDNTLTGLDGDDVLDGAAGADTMVGGDGWDTYHVDDINDVVVELEDDGIDAVVSSITYTLGANLEVLELSGSAAIDGTGNADDNLIKGNTGANTLSGLDGDDALLGGNGNDRLSGGKGADGLLGGVGNDRLSGG